MAQISPTFEEFQDFNSFVENHENQLEEDGFLLVNPPHEWFQLMHCEESQAIENLRFIPRRVTLEPNKEHSGFELKTEKRICRDTLGGFEERCAAQYTTPLMKDCTSFLKMRPSYDKAECGEGLQFKLFPESLKVWNLNCLGDPMSTAQKKERELPGVTLPLVSIGTYGVPFALRVDPHNLGTIFYLHKGEPREWYPEKVCEATGSPTEDSTMPLYTEWATGRVPEQCSNERPIQVKPTAG